MDCCDKKGKEGCCKDLEKMKGGKSKMDKKVLMWIVIGALFLATLFLTFKAAGIGAATANVASAAASSASSGMVGGC